MNIDEPRGARYLFLAIAVHHIDSPGVDPGWQSSEAMGNPHLCKQAARGVTFHNDGANEKQNIHSIQCLYIERSIGSIEDSSSSRDYSYLLHLYCKMSLIFRVYLIFTIFIRELID